MTAQQFVTDCNDCENHLKIQDDAVNCVYKWN